MWIVTGASGFVGSEVLRVLGSSGRGLYRRSVGVWNETNLARSFEGAEGVIHCASVVHRPSTPAEEYDRFNIDGTRAVVAAARSARVRRVVFISSIKVYGEAPAGTIDEKTPVAPDAHYARTKAAAERVVLDAQDLHPVVLRLCPVYGRGDKGNVRTVIRAIHRRRFLVPGDGSTRKSIVHVSTVADVVLAATKSSSEGVFVVADRHAPSIRELADEIAAGLGRRRPRAVPETILRRTADIVGGLARIARVPTSISGDLIKKSLTSSVCDPSRVERELGVTCAVDLRSALADEISWLREIRAL